MSARFTAMPTPSSTYARYVGRVGALAVALGIGAAVATGHGLGLQVARAEPGSESSEKSGDSPSGDSGPEKASPTKSTSTTSSASEKDGAGEKASATDTKASDGVTTNEPDVQKEPDVQEEPPAEKHPDTEKHDDPAPAGGTTVDHPAPQDDAPVVTPDAPVAVTKSAEQESNSRHDDVTDAPKVQVPAAPEPTTTDDTSTPRSEPKASSLRMSVVDTGADSPSTPQPQALARTMAVTAAAPTPTPQLRPLVQIATDLISATTAFAATLLAPFLSTNPATPAAPPTLWAVLEWVRREFERTFLNHTPDALPDAVTTSEGTPTTINVLGNDTDDPGDVTTVASYTQASHGTVVLNPDGTFTYTPVADFSGTDTFTYTITDATSRAHIHGLAGLLFGGGDTDIATVTITVAPVDDGPTANDDDITGTEDTPRTITSAELLANDTDGDNPQDLTVTAVGTPGHGTATLSGGVITYTPGADYNGFDQFSYTISDGTSTSTATVHIAIAGTPDAPVAADDTYTTDDDQSLTVDALNGLLHNDSDADGDPLFVGQADTAITTSAGGTVTIAANGSFTYTPKANFTGTDTFTYTIGDGTGRTSTATVSVTVTPVNDDPVARDDYYTIDENTTLNATTPTDSVLYNDTDADNDAMTVTNPGVHTLPGGTIELDARGTFTYTPNPNFTGTDQFTYTITDGNGGQATATVHITVEAVPDAPVAVDDEATTAEDTSVDIAVLANDTDADGDQVRVHSIDPPAHGTVTALTDGTLRYTPEADFTGTDTFTYTVTDGTGRYDTATVSVTVTPVNDDPVARDDYYTIDENTTLNATTPTDSVLYNDTDADNDAMTVTNPGVHTLPGGTIELDARGTFTYTPNPNFTGTDQFTYTITDGNGGQATATVYITVNPIPDTPTATPDTYDAVEDTPLTVDAAHGVLGNDSRGSGPTFAVANPGTITTSTGGSVDLDADGSFTYTPVHNWFGPDSFTYTATDGVSTTAVTTVTLNVASVNDIPVAADDAYQTNEDQGLGVVNPNGVLSNDTDGDGDVLSVKNPGTFATAAGGTVTIVARGTFTYTPKANWSGTDSFTYTATDGVGGEAVATVRITVVAVNDAPKANPDGISTAEDTPVVIDVLANDTDVEGDVVTVESFSQPTWGAVTRTADGKLVYTPRANWNGTETFTYTVTDGTTVGNQTTVTVTVTPVADAPVVIRVTQDSANPYTGVITGQIIAADPDQGTTLTYGGTYTTANLSTFVVHDDGTFTYTPSWIDRLAAQPITFGYTVSDAMFTTPGTITVSNTAPNTNSATQPRVTITDVRRGEVFGHIDGVTNQQLTAGWDSGDPSYIIVDGNGDFFAVISRTEQYAAYQAAQAGEATTLQFFDTKPDGTVYSVVLPIAPVESANYPVTVDDEKFGGMTLGHVAGGVATNVLFSPGGSRLVIAPNGDFYFTPSAADQYAASLGGPTTVRFDAPADGYIDNAPIVLAVEPNADYPNPLTLDYGSAQLGFVDGSIAGYSGSGYGEVRPSGSNISVHPDGTFTVRISAVDSYAAQQAGTATYLTFYVPINDRTTPVVVRVPFPGETSFV